MPYYHWIRTPNLDLRNDKANHSGNHEYPLRKNDEKHGHYASRVGRLRGRDCRKEAEGLGEELCRVGQSEGGGEE